MLQNFLFFVADTKRPNGLEQVLVPDKPGLIFVGEARTKKPAIKRILGLALGSYPELCFGLTLKY
jgi:hypothetical protein